VVDGDKFANGAVAAGFGAPVDGCEHSTPIAVALRALAQCMSGPAMLVRLRLARQTDGRSVPEVTFSRRTASVI
jgi:hypothetical protein